MTDNWEHKGDNVAYLDFVDRDNAYIVDSVEVPNTGLVLDFDENGALVGIESYNASSDLPEEVKQEFDKL